MGFRSGTNVALSSVFPQTDVWGLTYTYTGMGAGAAYPVGWNAGNSRSVLVTNSTYATRTSTTPLVGIIPLSRIGGGPCWGPSPLLNITLTTSGFVSAESSWNCYVYMHNNNVASNSGTLDNQLGFIRGTSGFTGGFTYSTGATANTTPYQTNNFQNWNYSGDSLGNGTSTVTYAMNGSGGTSAVINETFFRGGQYWFGINPTGPGAAANLNAVFNMQVSISPSS